MNPPSLRVLIVAEHASLKFGGEAALPLHYFRLLRERGMPAWLVVHERTRTELSAHFSQEAERIIYIPDTAAHRMLWKIGQRLPDRLSYFSTGFVMRVLTQWIQRRIVKDLVRQEHPGLTQRAIDDLQGGGACGHWADERRNGVPTGVQKAAERLDRKHAAGREDGFGTAEPTDAGEATSCALAGGQ